MRNPLKNQWKKGEKMYKYFVFALVITSVYLLGCEESNMITQHVFDDIYTQCDPEVDVNIQSGEYVLSTKIDKECVDTIIFNDRPNNTEIELDDFNSHLPSHIPRDPEKLFDVINEDIPTGSRFFLTKSVTIKAIVDKESLRSKGLEGFENVGYVTLKRIDIRHLGLTDPNSGRDIEEIIWHVGASINPETHDQQLKQLEKYKKDKSYIFHVRIQGISIQQYSNDIDSYYWVRAILDN